MTKNVKIVILGNPLPLSDNPVQLAEELAMIDMISKGRLVSGFVRGGGQEQLANNVNPAFNRDRFEEAHDLIVKTWTTPGPFRWEGTQYQHRVVNPWAVPMQKPHPRIWIPGVISREQRSSGRRSTAIPISRSTRRSNARSRSGDVRRYGGRGGLYRRSVVPWPAEADPRRRDRGEGAGERAAVPVDARRVHRPCTSGVEHARRLLQPGEPTRLRRVVHRAVDQPACPPGPAGTAQGDDDHRRHAEAGDR